MGENGAGKSTLMKCLIGIHPATREKSSIKGKEVSFKSTQEALDAGISMIHQEPHRYKNALVCDKRMAGKEPKKGILTDHKKMYDDCVELFQRMGLDIDPHEKMKDLTVAKMQMVEIIKAVSYVIRRS